ncbi:Trp biosynthesis-associated membrane protein [Timonella senegalensis]|uniref:Trp biosynthesis-associated membrane protein n=2 Tax=Timonella senegalensis TaxID=1465825 RepID=UPI002FDD4DC3
MSPTPLGIAKESQRPLLDRRRLVLTVLLLALAGIALANMTWLSLDFTSVLGEDIAVNVSGHKAAPGLTASGIVVVAAAIYLSIAGRVARYIALGVSALSALSIVGFAVSVLADPRTAVRTSFAEATGVSSVPEGVTVNLVGYAAIAVGILLLAATLWGFVAVRHWRVASSKYDRTAAAAGAAAGGPAGAAAGGLAGSQPDDPAASGDQGSDAPNADVDGPDSLAPDSERSDTGATRKRGSDATLRRGATGRPHDADDTDERALWDTLTQGSDPTEEH